MTLTRREILKFSVLAGGALLLPFERTVLAAAPNRIAESALPLPFTLPFAIPPVASPVRTDALADYYWLTMREQAVDIIPGFQTRIWGYDGMFPGPTFDVEQGREVVVRQVNQLPPAHPTLGYTPYTSVHLHGSASLPQYDGYASDVTYPGFYKDYRYPNFQEARTLWYHDHGVHHTASERLHGAGRHVPDARPARAVAAHPPGLLRRAAGRQRRDVRQPRASCSTTTTTSRGCSGTSSS